MEGLCQAFFWALETTGEKACVVPTLRGSLPGGPYPPGLVSKTLDGALCPPLGPCEGLTSVPSADDSPAFTPGHFFPGPPGITTV